MSVQALVISFFTVVFLIGSGRADAGESQLSDLQRARKMSAQEKLAKKSREVSGTILKSKKVDLPGKVAENLVVLIKTDKGQSELMVDLGDAQKFTADLVRANRKISAEGRLVRLGEHDLLVARKVRVDGRLIQIDRSAQKKYHKKKTSS